MTSDELKLRFRKFSGRIIKMVDKLPNTIQERQLAHKLFVQELLQEQITELPAELNLIKTLSTN